MNSFESDIRYIGQLAMPKWTLDGLNVRVMMLPILIDDAYSIPVDLVGYQWFRAIDRLCKMAMKHTNVTSGVAYITIDQAFVPEGETHRRPGLHVDGIGEDGGSAGYGGGGGYGGGNTGMFLVSDKIGCQAWQKTIMGWPEKDGKCEHLRDQCLNNEAIMLQLESVYWMNSLAIHESIPMQKDTYRSFMRLSMPNTAPWHHGYTVNPLGVKPTGPIHTPRPGMAYRPS